MHSYRMHVSSSDSGVDRQACSSVFSTFRVRPRLPQPHVAEQSDQSVHSPAAHSAGSGWEAYPANAMSAIEPSSSGSPHLPTWTRFPLAVLPPGTSKHFSGSDAKWMRPPPPGEISHWVFSGSGASSHDHNWSRVPPEAYRHWRGFDAQTMGPVLLFGGTTNFMSGMSSQSQSSTLSPETGTLRHFSGCLAQRRKAEAEVGPSSPRRGPTSGETPSRWGGSRSRE
mmetsp:Transcript_76087/g.215156  ORF Transcript_76087/g.215156 Transcript_76087/m.215156 type:complete len:225 (+) Transcript_76087:382-1056(+)